MINNQNFNILLIDNNQDFNEEISYKLKQYQFNTIRIFEENGILECIDKSHNEIDLILLNIDFAKINSTQIHKFIANNRKAKIILLSSEDIGEKREEYFSLGILDYHLINKKLDHIIDDIVDTIYSLDSNKNETILVVDSSKEICISLHRILTARNYTVMTVNSAKDALNILKTDEISLLILDMEINDIDALDLLEGLRDMYLLNQFFVLALSNNKSSSMVRDTLKGGAKDFLLKPFLYEEFVLKTDILVSSSRNRKITENQKKQIENNLKSFKELLDSSIGSMFIFENDICINCNNEAINLLGYQSKDSLLQKHIFGIFTNVKEKHKDYLLDDKIDYNFDDTIVSKDGTVYQVQIKERNIVIDEQILKIIAVMDVTEVKRHEKIISQQTKMASMGEMIGNIAHQWRQPLTAISVAAGGIKLNYEFDMEDREETIIELDNIVENTKFLSSTIESFQNFLNVDKITTQFNVESTLKKTLSIINANLIANKISIIENYNVNASIKGVENELMQVFLNIINNATDVLKISDKMQEKYVKLSIFDDKESVFITIHDSGNGISNEIINKIFEPYFTTKHQSQGTGLGLYMTHQIIAKMDGLIKVVNENFTVNKNVYYGAKFIMTFPIHK